MAFWRKSSDGHLAAAYLLLSLLVTPNAAAQFRPFAAAKVVQPTSFDRPTTGQEILAKFAEHNRERETQLHRYSVTQTYVVKNQNGRALALAMVRVKYQSPPGAKTFTAELARGSRVIRRLVFKRLMEQQARTATGSGLRASAIDPDNYRFDLLNEEQIGPYDCFVVRATPMRQDR
jgi:hypothetical protein